MSKVTLTPDLSDEYPAGPYTYCNQTMFYRRHACIYEKQHDGSYRWWTHGVGAGANVWDPPGECNCTTFELPNPLGPPIPVKVCMPPVHTPHEGLDYVGSNGNTHYFLGNTPTNSRPPWYILTDG
jgi:hypothetical protein